MRGRLVAGMIFAGHLGMMSSAFADFQTYQECVQDCREKPLPGTTLKRCIIERKCDRYPRQTWTYEDCVERCVDEANSDGQPVQQCIARYVCSQHPRR